jgi:hypothetical protein
MYSADRLENWSEDTSFFPRAIHFVPNIIRVIKFRRMKWAGQVARMGKNRHAYRVLMGKSEKTAG